MAGSESATRLPAVTGKLRSVATAGFRPSEVQRPNKAAGPRPDMIQSGNRVIPAQLTSHSSHNDRGLPRVDTPSRGTAQAQPC